MKALLVGINAKYIHTNLAIRNIAAYRADEPLVIYEATINDNLDDILEDILSYGTGLIGFSCYLWNIEDVLYTAENIKKVRPEATIVLGGPEVSYEAADLLAANPCVDYIILGEGEERFWQLYDALSDQAPVEGIDGLTYRINGQVAVNEPKGHLDLSTIPFSYGEESLEHKLVYYETSRGCPFRCAFCLSSLETGVRMADLKKVEQDLQRLAGLGVKVVKLVDRSFNCNLARAVDLFNLIRRLPGQTVFHCEINPELVNEDFIKNLAGLKERLQFEVGIQSTNIKTLREISRTPDVNRSLEGIRMLKATGIMLHVDLIAGLPYEGFERFSHSFDDVYELCPQEIQLGFLKLLKGTRLKRDAGKYGIVYRAKPPYEILFNDDISYRELCVLKGIAYLTDKYYNSGRFQHSLAYLIKSFSRPFDFYAAFYEYWNKQNYFRIRHSLKTLYDLLYDYASQLSLDKELFKDLIKFDFILANGKAALPSCIEAVEDREFLSKTKEHVYAGNWLEEHFPQMPGLSKLELSKRLTYGLFKHDVPGSSIKRDKVIAFAHMDGKSRYAEVDV